MSTNLSTTPKRGKTSKGDHLKFRNGWFHYYRVTPKRFRDVETQRFHCFSLHTQDAVEAKAKAATITRDLNRQWEDALQRGVSLNSEDLATKYQAAVDAQIFRGFQPAQTSSISDEELIARLRSLFLGGAHPLRLSKKPFWE